MSPQGSIGRRGVAAGLALLAAVPALAAAQGGDGFPEGELIRALKHGGYVVVMRHASSPAAPPAPADAEPGNLGRERQLDASGRASAIAMGEALKALQIPVGDVLSSPTYRAQETARLVGLGSPTTYPQLGDGGASMQALPVSQTSWLRAKVAERPRAGTDTFIVTQYPNIQGAFGQTAANLTDGAALVFFPEAQGGSKLLGRIPIEDWPRLAREAPTAN
jgi:hypothetical protein